MDIWHWWLAKLVVAQILYLTAFLAGMRALNQWRLARVRSHRPASNQSARMSAFGSSAPFQKF
ncbi:MAG: hypothetical protein QM813_26135 [Verrucomicrobiota bacterium]